MSNKKQTAVEWLEEQIKEYGIIKPSLVSGFNILIKQAKEMEKKQIIVARVNAPLLNTESIYDYVIEAKQYYEQTYGGNNE